MIHNWYIQKLKYISEVLGLFNNGVKMHLKGILHSRHIVCSIWTRKSEFPSFQSVISTGNAPWSRKNHHQSWPQNHRWLLHTSTAAVICCLLLNQCYTQHCPSSICGHVALIFVSRLAVAYWMQSTRVWCHSQLGLPTSEVNGAQPYWIVIVGNAWVLVITVTIVCCIPVS